MRPTPLQRLERLVIATATVQTGALSPSCVFEIWNLWADVDAAPPALARKAASLLSARFRVARGCQASSVRRHRYVRSETR